MELDKSTGLPVLPEDYFWRVKDLKGTNSNVNDGEIVVQIIREVLVSHKRTVSKSSRKWTNLWFETFEEVEELYEALEEDLVLSESLCTLREVDEITVQQYLDAGWKKSYRNYWEEPKEGKFWMTLLLEPTVENVLTAAIELFFKFGTLQEKKLADERDSAARAELAGDYPPKSLNSVNVDGGIKASNVEEGES